jgi:allene oxide cyclase
MREAMKRMGLGLMLGAVLVGCGGDLEQGPTVRTIRVVERADTDATTDNEPKGDSAGDVLTFANALFDESNTRQVGTDQGFCVRVVAGQSYECMWTAFLEEGQLTVEGPFFDTKGSTLAITGGTDAFNGARGQMQLEFRNPQGTEFNFIYEVLLDR